MSAVWVHGVPPVWFSDFITKAKPFCASAQLFSITLPSMSTRFECFDSKRFFTCQTPFHETGRVMWLPRIVMSEGDAFGVVMSPPPNMTTSWPASRWLFWMRKGPGPFQPTIAWESPWLLWQSLSHESTTALVALLSITHRLTSWLDVPWM